MEMLRREGSPQAGSTGLLSGAFVAALAIFIGFFIRQICSLAARLSKCLAQCIDLVFLALQFVNFTLAGEVDDIFSHSWHRFGN
ncbi:MAG: hypothetical protein ACE37N_01290 [Pseudohongiellaceae bacterium]